MAGFGSSQADPTFEQLLKRPSGIMIEKSANKPLSSFNGHGGDEHDHTETQEDGDDEFPSQPASGGRRPHFAGITTSRRANGSVFGAMASVATESRQDDGALDGVPAERPEYDDDAPESMLRNAILEKDLEEVRMVLEAVDLSEEYHDEDGMHFLHIAVNNELHDIVDVLLVNGANPNVVTRGDGRGYAPLHFTCKFGAEKLAQSLIKAGANVNIATEHGHTPLHLAVQQGLVEHVDVLLEHGALVDVKNHEGHEAADVAARAYSQIPAQHFENASCCTTLHTLRVKAMPLLLTHGLLDKVAKPAETVAD